MFYIITMIVIVAAVYFITYSIFRDDEGSTWLAGLVLVVLLFVPFINNFVGWYDEYVDVKIYNIVSLDLVTKVNSEIEGSFILGCGNIGSKSVDQEPKYVFVSEEEYGKQIRTLDVKNVYLKETNEEVPQLIERRKVSKRKHNVIDYLWGEKGEERDVMTTIERRTLVIPKNTIKINYNIEI